MTDNECVILIRWLDDVVYGSSVSGERAVLTDRKDLKIFLELLRQKAEPRLPKEPVVRWFPATERYTMSEWDTVVDAIRFYHRALYAHLARPHVDFGAVDEARMDVGPRVENPELRAAISVLRGWSAEAAGRTGLQPAVRMVCDAAEATLPKTMVRIRGKRWSGENFDFLAELPISQTEVEPD